MSVLVSQQQQPSSPESQSMTDQKGIPKSKRKLQKHLRSAGLAYVSRTGKLIPAKKVSDELCQCPHKCDELVPMEARNSLFQHFYGLGEADRQNQFLRQNMDLRARLNLPETTGTGRPPRRITCKYLVPLLEEGRSVEVCQKAFVSAFVITTKRVRLQREKLISSLGLNSYRSHNRSKKDKDEKKEQLTKSFETNNNNNILWNNNTITLSSLKSQFNLPSNLSLYVPSNATHIKVDPNILKGGPNYIKLEQKLLNNNESTTSDTSSAKRLASILGKKSLEELRELNITLEDESNSDSDTDTKPPLAKRVKKEKNLWSDLQSESPLIPLGLMVPDGVTIAPVMGPDHDRNLAIVNNFFHNQLWKPEYIGALS
ncbi:uncharacterized protein LOC126739100 [Anthonomus grandis grandis]|uniref:uncharacterized protein LOC126739100 n=1 Tax=Anthonomus grandis grandis TaxID=2921223 RepID=UPI0021662458|nr:uncharacterized protein LOC126739100 [Anthonomus grandis grandis]